MPCCNCSNWKRSMETRGRGDVQLYLLTFGFPKIPSHPSLGFLVDTYGQYNGADYIYWFIGYSSRLTSYVAYATSSSKTKRP
ncbi:hypothetical protein V6N13_038049 [Hibiscus sabdariffa]|uniref:Uncharacterized protein n=1 Tax=Hibiscus sabdariffa TaxID=183260 RepID=A0ABR2S377_9ROSI